MATDDIPTWALWVQWTIGVLTLPAVLAAVWQAWRAASNRPRVAVRATGTHLVLRKGELKGDEWVERNARFDISNRNGVDWDDLEVVLTAIEKGSDPVKVPFTVEDKTDEYGRRTVSMQVGLDPAFMHKLTKAWSKEDTKSPYRATLSLPARRTVRFQYVDGLLAPKIRRSTPFLLQVRIQGGPVNLRRWFLVRPKEAYASALRWWSVRRWRGTWALRAYQQREGWSSEGEGVL